MFPWNDQRGRVCGLKLAVFVALFVPGVWIASAFALGALGARPLTEAIREIGLWTIRFLFIALAVTPLRQVLQWPQLTLVRRMLGVAAFAYGITHLSLYIADENFRLGTVVSEIALRIYLTIGFAALCGLAALAATSTDRMVRRLGYRRWQRLHRIVYGIAVLGLIHFWMQAKLAVWEPTVMIGLYAWLMGYRLLARWLGRRTRLPIAWVGGLSLLVAAATALGEAGYFWLAMGAPPLRVLEVNFSLVTGVRPAVVVLGAGLVVTAGEALRTLLPWLAKRRPRFA